MAEREPGRRVFRRVAVAGLAAVAAIMAMALLTASADALEIQSFSATPSLTQAGGHPDLTIHYQGENHSFPLTTDPCQCNDPKDVIASLPTGFIGNPHATPQCKAVDFVRNECPADSQVGVISVVVDVSGSHGEIKNEPIYNTVPRPNQAGLLSAMFLPNFIDLPLYTVLSARTGTDYGLDSDTADIERQFVLVSFTSTLWGVPADDSHTPLRRRSNTEPSPELPGVPSNSPRVPFLTNPGTCSESPNTTVTVIGYDHSVETATDPWPASTGCDQLTFNPSLSAKPTTTAADSASGIDVDLTVPQLLSPTFPSPSEIRAATVTLPVGFSINPNAADGKTACSDAAASFGSTEEARCPEFAKIGTDVIDSPALPMPISGGIYLGTPQPGNRYRIFLTADGFATHIKIAGTAKLDQQTGQVVASFDSLPQSPLTEFNLHFFGAERGLFATPVQCGTYAVNSTFTPWDELLPVQHSTQFFSLDSGPGGAPCPEATRPFHPGFTAASVSNMAGAHSPFTLDLKRNDGEQNLSDITVTAPPGFSATLAGIPYCPDAALAAAASSSYSGTAEQLRSSCPLASQVGTAIAGVGAGTHPVYLPGKVYLAGPYKGAPLSLAVITPAVSGPYDLGNVVVRVALSVDPTDAHVTAVSDPLPQIFEGVPLRLRQIRVNLDRPDFALNPTNCDPFQVATRVLGDQGSEVDLPSHFQVANCASLPFQPGLSVSLTGGLGRLGHPAIHSVFTARPGEANTRSVTVTLPKGELLDDNHIGAVCSRVDFAVDACPAGSLVGHAEVATPLLDRPLAGSIYLRSSQRGLPDLALDLEGQVDIEATAKVDSVNGRYRASFKTVPDVPVSKISLTLLGGRKGLLQNSEPLCTRTRRARVQITGQNGAEIDHLTELQVACGKGGKGKRNLPGGRVVSSR
jgi:hypothetical protein